MVLQYCGEPDTGSGRGAMLYPQAGYSIARRFTHSL